MRYVFLLICYFSIAFSQAQELYFPPAFGTWETLAPSELNWCEEELEDLEAFLDERDSKAFIVLKDGRMVLEWYFDDFTQDSLWYWASAGKSLTSVLVGIAQEEGLLDINNPTSDYLGTGWTSMPTAQEEQITVRHQLMMSTGIDDDVESVDCTDPECLTYLTDPVTRWAYHNAPYTLLGAVIESASGQTLNQFFTTRVGNTIGAIGAYIQLGNNRVFFSRPRDMARYGLLVQADGQWNGATVLGDQTYLEAMRTPSQDMNPSYGYLWWLNGQESYLYPRLQVNFPGPLIPTAPDDMYAGLGKNDQKLYIVPSQGLVIVRMGEDASDGPLALSAFDVTLWEKISALNCITSSEDLQEGAAFTLSPNPVSEILHLRTTEHIVSLDIYNLQGQRWSLPAANTVDVSGFVPGVYFLQAGLSGGERLTKKLVVK